MQRFLLFLACLTLFFSSDAQSPETAEHYPFVHYTPKDGLVNSRVRKAYQDSKGRMYFLTYGGLSVFDGARFRNYTTQNGLIIDVVNDILEVGEDSLLVAVNWFGLNVLVRGEMKRLEFPNKVNPIVNHFLKSSNGEIYAAADDGLYRLETDGFRKLNTWFDRENESAIYLGKLVEYKDFLVFTTNDLRRFTRLYAYSKSKNKVTDLLPDLYVHSLATDLSGNVWVSSSKNAVLDTTELNAGRLSLIKPAIIEKFPQLERSGLVVFLKENVLILTARDQTFLRVKNDGSYQSISLATISSTGSTTFFIDRENVTWFCHGGSGVYKLTGTGFQAGTSYFGDQKTGARFEYSPDRSKTWLIMNDDRLLYSGPEGKKYYSTSPRLRINSVHANPNHLYFTVKNDIYIGAIPDHGSLITIRKIHSIGDSLILGGHSVNDAYGNSILMENTNLYVVKNDKMIFRTSTSSGVIDLIEGICTDNKKQLWTVNRGIGLQLFSLHPDNPPGYLRLQRTFTSELGPITARSMIIDKNDLIWIGTRYDGLLAFEYKNGELLKRLHFRTRDGLTDNFVTSLETDEDNNILIGTQTGLDRLIRTNNGYIIENITKLNNSFAFITYLWSDQNRNAYALTNDGDVLVGSPGTELEFAL